VATRWGRLPVPTFQGISENKREASRKGDTLADLADRPFRWEDLDQRLLSPRLQDLAEDMHKRVAEGERKAAFDAQKTGNTAGYLPRLFEVQHQLTDEWAKKLYDVHCEVWRIQGHSITADFIRAVSWCTRTGRNHDAAALGHWTRMMVSLRAEWARDLEAEAVASEYGSSQEIAQRAAAQFFNVWQSFRVQFEALADEELQPSANAPRGCLTASVSYENGSECGEWFISGGYDEHFTARCTTLLSRAGAALNPPKGTKPLFFWLRRLYLDLLKHKSNNLCFARQDRQQGIIQLVPRTSATLCSRLEQEAVETSLHTHPSVNGQTARKRTHFNSQVKRLIAIQLGQNPGATDLEICRALDADGGLELPKRWRRAPQDRLFEEAYLDPRRRNKIEVTISKVRRGLRGLGVLPSR
jgi:hypothetical protein